MGHIPHPSREKLFSESMRSLDDHYAVLGIHSTATPSEIRQTYRELSKRYHPDTTLLPANLATVKFQRLKIAYEVLSNAERRSLYDLQRGYVNIPTPPPSPPINAGQNEDKWSHTAYLDPQDRPLSAGEIFALGLLALTLLGCLGLAFLIAWLRGDAVF